MLKTIGKIGAVAALAAGLVTGAGAQEAITSDAVRGKKAGDFVIGLGAVGVLPSNGGSTTIGGTPQATNAASPLLDFTYFVHPMVSLNLIAASTRHQLTLAGSVLNQNVQLGSVWALPPTLTLQVHPLPQSRISPYFGLGINVTWFYGYGSALTPPVNRVRVDTVAGPSFNVGVDYELAPNWLLNLDVKKILMEPGVSVNSGAVTGTANLNPWVVSGAVRYRF